MNNNNWGMSLVGAILLLTVAGGLYVSWEISRANAIRVANQNLAKEEQVRQQAERDLRTFAETHLGELQRLIDEIQDEIQVRQRKLTLLAEEMRRVKAVPQTDPDYVRWNRAIVELQKKLDGLLTERRDTYVELKKFEFNPEAKPELDKQREERLKKARGLAEQTREQFNDLRKDKASQPPEQPVVPVTKDGDKDKGKAAPPAKKSGWRFW